MYDKISGVQLYEHDKMELPLENDPYVDVVPILQRIESRLTWARFSQIGSIYYKEDVSQSLRDRPLYAPRMSPTANSARFCIGPTVNREFWRAGRAALDIDRGPWPDVHSYMFALAKCARTSINIERDLSVHDTYRSLISDYEKLVPHFSPLHSYYTLWHPDLHASNIIATETTHPCKLTGIVDWQGSVVAPYFMQIDVPPAFVYEKRPFIDYSNEDGPRLTAEFDTLDDEKKQVVCQELRRVWRQKLHEAQVRDQDAVLGDLMYGPTGVVLTQGLVSPSVAITRGTIAGLEFIRHSFVTCRSLWKFSVGVDENGTPLVPFPLDISDADAEQIEEEWQAIRRDESMCDELLERLGIPLDSEGIVDVDKYEATKRAVEDAKQAVLNAAPSQEERDRLAKAWPLQDGKVSLTAEACY